MKTQERYVLFYCDDCELLAPAVEIFKGLHNGIELQTLSDPEELLTRIKERMPELLLIYLYDPEKDYINLVKEIRKNTVSTSIPVLIYKELPGKEEMQNAFRKIKIVPE